jgi:hypothetical protein
MSAIELLSRMTERLSGKQKVMQLLTEEEGKLREALRKDKHPFESIVLFFSATSRLQDNLSLIRSTVKRSAKRADKDAVLCALEKFTRQVNEVGRTGRKGTGINRTNKGEEVNMDNIFLGNIGGLKARPVKRWLDLGYADLIYVPNIDAPEIDIILAEVATIPLDNKKAPNKIDVLLSEVITIVHAYTELPDNIAELKECLRSKR